MKVNHIAVGVDESVATAPATDAALSLARLIGARVTFVHAIGLLEEAAHPNHPWPAGIPKPSHPSVDVSCVVELGPPAIALNRFCEDNDVDLLVVGRRRVGAGSPIGLGSTSRGVVDHAHLPVLLVAQHEPRG